MSGEVRTVERTLSSGRVVQMRRVLPMRSLIRSGILSTALLADLDKWQTGKLKEIEKALELEEVIVRAMWVDPQVEDIELLDDDEIEETLTFASAGGAAADTFREVGGGPGDGGGGEVLADAPERAGGAGGGKSGGVDSGRGSGAAPGRAGAAGSGTRAAAKRKR